MSGGVIYSVTRKDVRDAIELCSLMGSNPISLLWCDGNGEPESFGAAPCGHTDPWWCAAAALGASPDAVNLMIRTANAVVDDAWSAEARDRDAEGLVVRAPHRDTVLFSEDLEAECLLREGWLPSDYRLTRRHHPNRGEYIALHWEYDEPDAWYVRGHVDKAAFRSAIDAYFGDYHKNPIATDADPVIRHAHAWWACEGNDGYGNAHRVLRECAGAARGAFSVTVMDSARRSP